MKHATGPALDEIEGLLNALRKYDKLAERRRGVFYLKRSAFVHFHEDAGGMFADIRLADGWKRFRVESAAEKREFLGLVTGALR